MVEFFTKKKETEDCKDCFLWEMLLSMYFLWWWLRLIRYGFVQYGGKNSNWSEHCKQLAIKIVIIRWIIYVNRRRRWSHERCRFWFIRILVWFYTDQNFRKKKEWQLFNPKIVTDAMMKKLSHANFMLVLPASRGERITDEVLILTILLLLKKPVTVWSYEGSFFT